MADALNEEPLDSATEWVADHTRSYVDSDGEVGHEWMGVRTLVLTTVGRRSGKPRRNALIYGRDGDSYVVVASKGGAAQDPLWYKNLQADPRVQVQVMAEHFGATARPVTGDERDRLWAVMAAIWPDYNDYQTKTSRQIPVVVLEPR